MIIQRSGSEIMSNVQKKIPILPPWFLQAKCLPLLPVCIFSDSQSCQKETWFPENVLKNKNKKLYKTIKAHPPGRGLITYFGKLLTNGHNSTSHTIVCTYLTVVQKWSCCIFNESHSQITIVLNLTKQWITRSAVAQSQMSPLQVPRILLTVETHL